MRDNRKISIRGMLLNIKLQIYAFDKPLDISPSLHVFHLVCGHIKQCKIFLTYYLHDLANVLRTHYEYVVEDKV